MKKHLIFILSLCFVISTHSFAQVDSAKIAETERQIGKDRKKADKLQRKADKKEKKMKRQARKKERKEQKRDRKLKKLNKSEKKLEELRKDSTSTGYLSGFPSSETLYWRRSMKSAS
jgi:flagellar biosynthesis GTPase FlhF